MRSLWLRKLKKKMEKGQAEVLTYIKQSSLYYSVASVGIVLGIFGKYLANTK